MKAPRCNLCGESCLLETVGHPTDEHRNSGGLEHASVEGNYDSTPGNGHGALDDLSRYRFSLCEFCLDWLFQQFVVPPEVHDVMTGADEGPFVCAADRVVRDDYRTMKQEFFEERDRRLAKLKVRSST